MNNLDRENLPYREKVDLLCYDKKTGLILVQDNSKKGFLKYPGGGIDAGENPKEAGAREIIEETNRQVQIVNGEPDFKRIGTVEWNFFPEWIQNEKTQKRYDTYKGERVHMLVGKLDPDNYNNEINPDDDSWDMEKGKNYLEIIECIKKHITYSNNDNVNTHPYRVLQLAGLIRVGELLGKDLSFLDSDKFILKNKMPII